MMNKNVSYLEALVRYAQAHSFEAWVNEGGEWVTVLERWWNPDTQARGVDYRLVKTLDQLRRVLGY